MNALAQLRDIHPPIAPTLWPPAPGWWLAAAVTLLALALLARPWRQRYDRWRRRRLALAELARLRAVLEQDGDRSHFAAGVSMLLRRLALARYPRAQVAGLSGDRWLQFLDQTGDGDFITGPGRVLALAPYQINPELPVAALEALARQWIKRNA